MRRRILLGQLLILSFVLAGPGQAVDCVIEIHPSCAAGGGCVPRDAPGYPVEIQSSGSDRLTGSLLAPLNLGASVVSAPDVTIDLNGFRIEAAGLGGTPSDAIQVVASAVEIRNGVLRGFSRSGVFAPLAAERVRVIDVRSVGNGASGIALEGKGHHIERCLVSGNGVNWPPGTTFAVGIQAGEGSLVQGSVVRDNVSWGLLMHPSAGYGSNVFTGNNGGSANQQVNGGTPVGINVCGATSC